MSVFPSSPGGKLNAVLAGVNIYIYIYFDSRLFWYLL